MTAPIEHIRALLARHDAVVVGALACRALCGRAPDGFYARPGERFAAAAVASDPGTAPFQERIVSGYVTQVVPLLAPPAAGAPGAVDALRAADAAALESISARLGLSLQVAACKLEGRDARLRAAAAGGDPAALEALITYPSVEQLVLLRVRSRASEYVRTHNVAPALASRLPDALNAVYAAWLIPLSRAIQAAWLVTAVRRERAAP